MEILSDLNTVCEGPAHEHVTGCEGPAHEHVIVCDGSAQPDVK